MNAPFHTPAHDDDFDFEPIRGLPQALPPGEALLWQGAPDWRSLAVHAFHIRKAAGYFAVLVLWLVGSALWDGRSAAEATAPLLWALPLAGLCCGILAALAWGYHRTTVYSITSRRIVIRQGIALPLSINIPFRTVESADLRTFADDTGNIAMTTSGNDRIAWLALWPSARPWQLARPQPMLRCVPDAVSVASLLSRALAAEAEAGDEVRLSATTRADAPAPRAEPAAAAA